MKPASIKEIRDDLKYRSKEELMELCLRLGRFKKDNKELLTYLLFESDNEESFIRTIKEKIENDFEDVNAESYYFAKKSIQKILKDTKKFIRYSGKKETEVELLLHFCRQLNENDFLDKDNVVLYNLYKRQLDLIEKRISKLHEDLQYDFSHELKELQIPVN